MASATKLCSFGVRNTTTGDDCPQIMTTIVFQVHRRRHQGGVAPSQSTPSVRARHRFPDSD